MKGNCKFCLRYGSECIPHIDCDEIPYTGILADFQIHELIDLGIIEADHAKVQPTSVDLHLGEKFYFENFMGADIVDKSRGDHVKWGVSRMTSTSEAGENHIYLSPGAPCLASVREKVKLPPWLTMELRLTSTEGRDCIQHALAVWGDPGFEGCMTLELQNVSQHHTIVLSAGDRICQAVFHKHLPVQNPYHGRYQGDTETSKPKG